MWDQAWLRAGIVCLMTLGIDGCSGCSQEAVVTGSRNGPTFSGTQSETTSESSYAGGRTILVVAYNDDTADGTIQYTATDRIVFPGASLLGWSYSLDYGQTWTYGGKVRPPRGVAALWGDPAIVTSRTNYARVYITSLAIAAAKIPPTGHHGFMDDGSITGACIARSDDGGIHFAIQTCVSSNNDFYDGSALAAAGNWNDHRIFAAFRNVPRNRIDIWASSDGLAPFSMIGDPFPGMRMISHPRLAYDDSTGALLVAAIDDRALIFMNRLVGNSWQRPVQVSWATTRIDIPVGAQTIRTAYGFSFDVGAPSQTELRNGAMRVNADAIRLLYTTRDSGTRRIYVRGSACNNDLSDCHDVPQWGTTPGNLNTPRDQWNPTVTAWPGLLGTPPVWKATYQTTDDQSDAVSIHQGNLAVLPNGVPIFVPFQLVAPRKVCPDFRYGSPGRARTGYWGDYDEVAVARLRDGGVPEFLMAFSDSSQGCLSQSKFTSNHLHIRSVLFQ